VGEGWAWEGISPSLKLSWGAEPSSQLPDSPARTMPLPTPRLSFAEVLWPLDDKLAMLKCTVERRFQKNCEVACREILEEGSFLPARAILLPEDGTLDDPHAVSIYALTKKAGLEVAVIRGRTASLYRRQLEVIGYANEPVEVLMSIQGSLRTQKFAVGINLPEDFDEYVLQGYHTDPANRPTWLSDPSPVQKRRITRTDGGDFTPDEQRKICCWKAKQTGKSSMPRVIENAVAKGAAFEHELFGLAIKAFAL
jgi:hypothetical protein